jgi:mycothiol system anti-sigma-R factor
MDDCGPECEETLREIQAFLDGELDPSLRERVHHHLSDCNPCMQRAEFQEHLKAIVHEKCAERAVPDELADRIRVLLRSSPSDDAER